MFTDFHTYTLTTTMDRIPFPVASPFSLSAASHVNPEEERPVCKVAAAAVGQDTIGATAALLSC